MEPQMYNGTVHPEVWLNKLKLFCYQKNITVDENVLRFCKTLVHPSINVTEAKTFNEIINIIKSDISFESYKNSVKRKLKRLKFDNNKFKNEEEILKNLNEFQQLCYEAEIKEFEEQKRLFMNALSTCSIQHKFICDNLKKINSIGELFKFFDQSLLKEKIFNGSYIALKHVATGKYLSCCGDIKYQEGSKCPIVFSGQTFPVLNSTWIISTIDKLPNMHISEPDPVFYGNTFYLFHKATGKKLDIDKSYKSPVTQNTEVSITSFKNEIRFQLIATNSANNNTDNNDCILSKDIITLKNSENCILRSHEITFTIDDKTYQEVIGHNGRIGGNDEWCIELVDDDILTGL
ncbi:hypothetical protein GLOIN_2v1834196 [Rhizophagus clarus]|uniref:MIR domain-containing protein n=1 Tax=Rhizophagus clarus TaxID=94130 RepID=A0A8H3M166_9GLOM|nr:hypothetical protein GLOIN_2v1834196 [Rhizophagus clarus]